MRKTLFALSLLFFSLFSYAQIDIDLTLPDDVKRNADTIYLCQEQLVITANISYPDGSDFEVQTTDFGWDFGDGNSFSASGSNTAPVNYVAGGTYYLQLEVTDSEGTTASRVWPIKVSVKPDFKDTEAPEFSCKWDKLELKGVVNVAKFDTKPDSVVRYPTNPAVITDTETLRSSATFRRFGWNQSLENAAGLLSVRLNLEHSDLSDLSIALECPNGSQIALKAAGGESVFAGEPVAMGTNFWAVGKGYDYAWGEMAMRGTMSSATNIATHDYVDVEGNSYTAQAYLPSAVYTPAESFDKLVGCPLNGDWTLIIVDSDADHNGFLSEWSVVFAEDVSSTMFAYQNQYDLASRATWYSANNDIRSYLPTGTAYAQRIEGRDKPFEYTEHSFKFMVTDDFGCNYDTTVIVTVSKPKITADPMSEDVPFVAKFSTETEWANGYAWNFGNGESSTEEAPTTEYAEGGAPDPRMYKVILRLSSEQGCTDSDTIEIEAREPDSSFEMPNVFAPGRPGASLYKIKPAQGADAELRFEKFNLMIYSRWGQIVYQTRDWQDGWDGSVGLGQDAASGTYYYVVKAEGKDKQKHNMRGALFLYRE